MTKRKRSKVIRNYTDKTASDTLVKANERINQLDAENARLRQALEQCRTLLDKGHPGNPDEWIALREVVNRALQRADG